MALDDGVLFECFKGEPILVPPLHFYELENGGWDLIVQLREAKLRREEVKACLGLIELARPTPEDETPLAKRLPWNKTTQLIAHTVELLRASGLMDDTSAGEAGAGVAGELEAPASNGSMETAPQLLPSLPLTA